MMKQAILLLAAVLVPGTLGYGSGAPTKACVTLQPGHYGTSKQTSDSPYSIGLEVSEYTPGTKVAVTINGGDFQGILLQARKADGNDTTPIGTFSDAPANTKTTQCTAADDSFTHSSKDVKNGITVQWNPPSQAAGDVKFYATVAQEKATYWMDIESASLTVQEGGSSSNSTEAPSNPTQGSTEQPSSAGSIVKSALMFTLLIPVFGAFLVKVF